MADYFLVKHCDAIRSCFSFLMANTINFIKSLCFPILFFLCMLFLCIPLLQCSPSNCLEDPVSISNDSNSILVSPGGVFELGFFAPDEKAEKSTYLGIWYHEQSNPKIVVWVANRDKPLVESNGYLIVNRSIAKVCDGKGVVYWSTDTVPSEVKDFTKLCLYDTGNLVLTNRRQLGSPTLWQSFKYPTDTLLPGMTADNSIDLLSTSLNLTSWQNHNNPAPGNFKFPLQPNLENQLHIVDGEMIEKKYWQSRITPFDKIPLALSQLWFNESHPPLPNNTRLVMNFTGKLQFWIWDGERGWSLDWSEPKDNCSVSDKCGYFGSCNSKNEKLCKCLPGFKPSANYSLGETSGGCSLRSGNICDRNDKQSDIFLTLPKMKLGNRTCTPSSSEENCTVQCLNDCHCVAYSNGYADCSLTGTSTVNRCLTWSGELTDLQEDYQDGITIFVRTTRSDLDPTSRGCSPCGTSIIPYPLSTGRNCGDPLFFNFHCNATTGQVYFLTQSGNFRITNIDPDAYKFSIEVVHASCDSRYINSYVLSPNQSSPFTAQGCNVVKEQPLTQVDRPSIEVDIGWQPPPEFACNTPSDCIHWPNTFCKRTNEGKMRCICGPKFHWNGTKLECIHKKRVLFPLKVVAPCIAGASAIFLVCIIYLVYLIRKRRMAHGQGLFEFKGDDSEAIDVPLFDWEIILAATNNFADANRLGIGGFGSVYMGKLLDGQEIAVKRLSSVSVQGVQEFRTEVILIAKLQHRNLVKLLGYCMKAEEKILVYEFMPNGSLDACLFDEKHSVYLDWKKRLDIILGIARGLLYLHQDSRLRIIHRDLKPSNILLDEEFNPKIADFGIARIVGGKETQANTGRVVGTYGYMSPEYAYEGIFSFKSDVFSFGVVILETISGRRNSRIFMFEHGLSLLGYAWKLWNEDKGLELMDPKLNESCFPSEVQKCIHIGLLCVQEDPSDRPTMSTVVYMLSGENASLPLAKQPAFMNRKPLSDNASSSSAKDSSMHEVMTVSTVGR